MVGTESVLLEDHNCKWVHPKSVVKEWYSGQHILVTGATGFMGKVLVEKLLRSCPEIGALYIFIRSKKGKTPEQRLEDFLESPVFDKIRDREDIKKLFDKLQCISGDLTDGHLNMSNDDQKLLQDNVTVVFHMAANVRFDQALKPAMLMNTGGTKNVLDFACTFAQLKVFVHVSTTYCHCNETKLEEKLYQAPNDPRKMLDLVKWMDNDLLEYLTPKLLKNYPNTYAYTKCLTEQLVSEYSSKLPLAIARPSIITAAWRDPFPGWIDNLNGPTGLMVGAGKGVIRTMHCNPQLEADIVPVDISINNLILIAWKIGSSPPSGQTEVYHISSNKDQAITWGKALECGRKHFYDNPFSVCLWYPGGSIKANYLVHVISAFFFHLIPAYVVDALLFVMGYKPFLIRTQKKIQNGLDVLQYYTTRPWYFCNDKLTVLWESLNNTDKEIFYSNRHPIIFNDYLLDYVLGARKFCMHEEPDTIPYARKVLRRLFYLDLLKDIILLALVTWIVKYCIFELFWKNLEY